MKGEKESRDEAQSRVAATLVKVHEAPARDPRMKGFRIGIML